MFLVYFLSWTFILYWVHRSAHHIPLIKKIHGQHHHYISTSPPPRWKWNNLLLFNDNWVSTLDWWITEVLPTILFCVLTGQWWIAIFHYIYAVSVQEQTEHNPNFSCYPWLSAGRWHLVHHLRDSTKNFGPMIIIWDKAFNTASDKNEYL